ncbi:MAG: Valine-tRNA ligase, partial [Parcubacteria group bacterium GW2011_GWC2_42_13]
IVISEEKIRGYQKFANKVWNVARFVLAAQNGNPKHEARNPKQYLNSKFSAKGGSASGGKIQNLTEKDKKILKELKEFSKEITKLMDSFKFYAAGEKIYHYFWHVFADKIIEEGSEIRRNRSICLKRSFRNKPQASSSFYAFYH